MVVLLQYHCANFSMWLVWESFVLAGQILLKWKQTNCCCGIEQGKQVKGADQCPRVTKHVELFRNRLHRLLYRSESNESQTGQ
jgi:hypothetical protein